MTSLDRLANDKHSCLNVNFIYYMKIYNIHLCFKCRQYIQPWTADEGLIQLISCLSFSIDSLVSTSSAQQLSDPTAVCT